MCYAEMFFADCMWPDFGETGLRTALDYYAGRQRRFGKVAEGGELTSARVSRAGFLRKTGCPEDL